MKMLKNKLVLIGSVGLVCVIGTVLYNSTSGNTSDSSELVDYNLHVRPILSDKCFACHGPDAKARQGGLRLDIADSAYASLKENPSMHGIKPKDRSKSGLWLRIISEDPDLLMPRPKGN
jgi:hypothetical protein